MILSEKIKNLLHGLSRNKKLLAELDAVKAENAQLKEENEKIYAKIGNEVFQSQIEIDHLRSDVQMYHSAYMALCKAGVAAEHTKAVYEAVAPYVDKNGFTLYGVAQQILGQFDFSGFAYEDNRGYFEEADGYQMMRYLLVQNADKLGKINAEKSRWRITGSCYEECVDLSIDTTSQEYRDFEKQLYIKVLKKLNLLTPAKAQVKEVLA